MNKFERYKRLHGQIEELLLKSPSPIAAMATVASVLFNKLPHFSWCGFYYLHEGELIIGPYQGPVACQTLKKHCGVCWASINVGKSLIVDDVEQFPDHIACDSRTKSEVVIPIRNIKGQVIAVLDVDSHLLASFDEEDQSGLEKIVKLLEPLSI